MGRMRHKNIFSDTWNVRARNALVGRLKGRGEALQQFQEWPAIERIYVAHRPLKSAPPTRTL